MPLKPSLHALRIRPFIFPWAESSKSVPKPKGTTLEVRGLRGEFLERGEVPRVGVEEC